MPDLAHAGSTVFLQPGELVTVESPLRVKTVVGSCLAIMMREPRLRVAAIAHCLLPALGAPERYISRHEALRYVDTTIHLMLDVFARRGASLPNLEIKIFGGADSIGGADTKSGYHVGRRNIEAAEKIFAAYGLPIATWGVGGRRGRSIEFHAETGEVLVRMLPALGRVNPFEEL